MKLEIWGSGGGEGYPAFFCNCDHCVAARKAGGKSLRTLHQAFIDESILIDLPMDTNAHLLKAQRSLWDIEHILITHVHADHFVPQFLDTRGGCFAHGIKHEKINFYGSSKVKEYFDGVFSVYPINPDIRKGYVFPELSLKQPVKVGKHTVIPLKAEHSPDIMSLNYIISDGKQSILYLVDTGYPTAETLDFIQKSNLNVGCVVMDCTMGDESNGTYCYHMSFPENIKLKKELAERGVITEKTPVVVTHVTHNSSPTHEEIEKYFEGTGITVAYDGFTLGF